jgi:CubicO group peptidase (beta-lactamase class C family)
VARELGVEPPIDLDRIIRFMTARPLDHDPGSKTVYSNFGYAVLGRLIEEVTGRSYETFVREEVLAAMGVETMRLGRTFPDERPDDEVSYYHPPPPTTVPAIAPRTGEVRLPDGGFNLELMAAHGGWIATPTDLVKLVTSVDGHEDPPDILESSTVRQMVAPPEEGADSTYYAMGWVVRPETGDSPEAWWHVGDLPGTTALLMHSDRTTWALLLNRSPWDAAAHETIRKALESAARQIASEELAAVQVLYNRE